jgi:hypothetical protein
VALDVRGKEYAVFWFRGRTLTGVMLDDSVQCLRRHRPRGRNHRNAPEVIRECQRPSLNRSKRRSPRRRLRSRNILVPSKYVDQQTKHHPHQGSTRHHVETQPAPRCTLLFTSTLQYFLFGSIVGGNRSAYMSNAKTTDADTRYAEKCNG